MISVLTDNHPTSSINVLSSKWGIVWSLRAAQITNPDEKIEGRVKALVSKRLFHRYETSSFVNLNHALLISSSRCSSSALSCFLILLTRLSVSSPFEPAYDSNVDTTFVRSSCLSVGSCGDELYGKRRAFCETQVRCSLVTRGRLQKMRPRAYAMQSIVCFFFLLRSRQTLSSDWPSPLVRASACRKSEPQPPHHRSSQRSNHRSSPRNNSWSKLATLLFCSVLFFLKKQEHFARTKNQA